MRVEYKLGEITAWSRGSANEFRYVDVFIPCLSGSGPHQTLELPVDDAVFLLAAIAVATALAESGSAPSAGQSGPASAVIGSGSPGD